MKRTAKDLTKRAGSHNGNAKTRRPPEHVANAVDSPPTSDPTADGFPIVGIGASAGGLAAFESFFSGMPAIGDPGMAFVLVQHLAPDHKSILTDLIRRYTRMQVFEVEDGMAVQPNCAYIIPPGRDMAFLNGALQLLEMQNDELRKAQAEIEAGRARYFDLYDLAPVGYVTVGEKGLVLEANLTVASLLGVNRAALVKQPLPRFILKKDRDLYYLLRKSLSESSGGQAHSLQTCELRMVKPDGSFFWAQLDAITAEAHDGAPACRIVISDITERKRLEEEIRAHRDQLELRVAERTRQLQEEIVKHQQSLKALVLSEANSNALFTAIPDPIFILSRDGRFVDCKAHSEVQLLMPRAQFIGRRIQDVLPPSVATLLQENLAAVFEGMNRHFDYQLVIGGETLFFEASLTKMDSDRALALVHNTTEGKRRELLVQQQASLITSLLDSIPDIIFFKDTNGVYLGCNPPFEAFVGRSRDQIVGRTDYDLFSRDVADAFRANDVKMLESDESRHNDEWITYPDGRSILIDTLKTPYRGPTGERIGILGISRDITERYRAEAQVKAQERLYRGLVESQSDLIVRVDMKNRFTFINDVYCQTFGKTREELIGQEFAPLVHPDDLKATMESLKGLEKPPHRVMFEQRAMTRTGWRWIAWEDSGILNDEGGVVEIQGVGHNITAHRQAMMALERLSRIQDHLMHLATGLINVPVTGQDAAINQALGDIGKLIDADRAYLMSYDFDTGMICNTHEWCNAGIEPQIANLQSVPMADVPEWVAAHKDGRETEVECVSALSPEDPLRHILEPQGIQSLITLPLTGESQCLGFVGFDAVTSQRTWTGEEHALLRILAEIFANFAMRNALGQRLTAARDQANTANRAKSEFLASMSHELRTPLNSVLGFAEVVTDPFYGDLNAKQREYINHIRGSGLHLLDLINDVLDLSKVEAGRMELELAPVNLEAVLENGLLMICERCKAHAIALALNISPELRNKTIEADARKLKQILFNLLSNAAKFTPDGGGITVAAQFSDDHPPSFVEISVTDTGIGIPAEFLGKIFEPFFQIAQKGSGKTPGTGLGIPLTRQFVELHGGTLRIESEGENKGCRASFRIPAGKITDGHPDRGESST